MQTYRGACHCRRVTFELQTKLDYVTDCTCSVCRRKGALWTGASDATLKILTGEAGPDAVPVQHHDGEALLLPPLRNPSVHAAAARPEILGR